MKIKVFESKIKNIATLITALGVIAGFISGGVMWADKILMGKINNRFNAISAQLDNISADTTRIQLLSMIRHDPTNHEAIMRIARHYFVDLGGDWYMTAIFHEWCAQEGVKQDFEMPL